MSNSERAKALFKSLKDRFFKRFLLVIAGVYFLLGSVGIYTGIVSVLSGGYADNILLGVIIATWFPAVCLYGYLILK